MATLIKKESSSYLQHLSKNKLRLFLILLAAAAIIFAAASICQLHKKSNLLQREVTKMKLIFSQYQLHKHQTEDFRIPRLEIALANSEAKLFNQGELIKRLEHIISHQSHQPDVREVNILQELKVHKDMYFQAQQKIYAYEQQLLALSQEMRNYKDQNQLIRQEQAKIKAEHQELLKKFTQNPEESLEKTLESKLSQLVNADYAQEEWLKELQKAVESCAKIGEMKALEVYYDDKINSLSKTILQNSNIKGPSDTQNLKQNLQKLDEEKEQIKMAVNKLVEHQKSSEARLNKLENLDNKTMKSHLVEEPVQSPNEVLQEAIQNYNILSQSGKNKHELKEAKKHLKELYREMNQQAEEVLVNQRDRNSSLPKQNVSKSGKPQDSQKEQKGNNFEKEQNGFENQLENDLHSLVDFKLFIE